ncbi:hypothetical protein Hanom_Chr06g00512391 [Helianthus anomalus]
MYWRLGFQRIHQEVYPPLFGSGLVEFGTFPKLGFVVGVAGLCKAPNYEEYGYGGSW